MLGGTPPKSNIDTKNDALEKISPFKHDVILDIYVSRKTPGSSPVMPPFEAIKDRPRGDHVIATTRKSSKSTKIIYSSWIEIVSHWGECSYLRVVSCGPWQSTIASALVSCVDGSANDHATVLDQHLGQVPSSTRGEFKNPPSHLALAAFLVQKVHHPLLRNLPCFQQAVIHVMISWRKKRNHWANSFKQLFLPAQPAIHLDPSIHLQCTVVFLVRIHVYV